MAEQVYGGDVELYLGLQEDQDTIIAKATDMWPRKRQFVSLGWLGTREFLESEAVRGSEDYSKGQPGSFSASGPMETELYLSDMLPYVQAVLNGDPATTSTDVANTEVFDDMVTPKGQTSGTTTVKCVTGSATAGQILVTQPTTPGRLKVILADATGNITLRGLRKSGLHSLDVEPIEVTVAFDDDHTAVTEVGSDHRLYDKDDPYLYFHELTEIEFDNAGLTIDTAANLEIVAEPLLKETTFSPESGVFDGWSAQMLVGHPRLGLCLMPNTGTFNFETMRLTMEIIGLRFWDKRTIEGGTTTEKLTDDSSLAAAEREFIRNTFFPGYGGYFEVDGNFTILKGLSLGFNNALDYGEGQRGSPTQAAPERTPDTRREFTATFRANFQTAEDADDAVINWHERYDDNLTVPLDLYSYYWKPNGKEFYHHVYIGEFQPTERPSTPVENAGRVEVNITGRAIIEDGDKVLSWTVRDEAGWRDSKTDPTVTITNDAASPSAGDTNTVTLKWNYPVSGLGLAGISAVDSQDAENAVELANFEKVADDEYTFEVTHHNTGAGNTTVTVAADAIFEGNAETSLVIAYT